MVRQNNKYKKWACQMHVTCFRHVRYMLGQKQTNQACHISIHQKIDPTPISSSQVSPYTVPYPHLNPFLLIIQCTPGKSRRLVDFMTQWM